MKMIITKKLTLDNLPDEGNFNGTINATAIFYDINPVLILEEHSENKGPDLPLAIDYYGPAAAARMGLPVSKTLYIVKTKGAFDIDYKEVSLLGLKKDSGGNYHAADFEWKVIKADRLKLILDDINEKPTKNLGKVGIFVGNDSIPRRRLIGGYDGTKYYDSEGNPINWKIVRVEPAGS